MRFLHNSIFFGMAFFLLACAQEIKALDLGALGRAGVSALEQPSVGEMEVVVEEAIARSTHPPGYPPAAFRAGIQGTVVLVVSVDAFGYVSDVSIDQSSGNGDLDKAGVRAAEKWRFHPALTASGASVPSKITIPVRFAFD